MKYSILAACLLVACGGSDDKATAPGAAGTGGELPSACSDARAQLLGSIDDVSSGDVSVLSSKDGVSTVYVDATGGGPMNAATSPWTFITLASPKKVSLTDVSAVAADTWDLALKRPLLYTNSGDGGPGQGGAVLVAKDFADVSAADADSNELSTEKFFDTECTPVVDLTGAAATSLSAWYDYDPETHILTPAAGTWIVRGAAGKLFKLQILSYYATPEGGEGMAGGAYLLQVAAL